MTGRSAPAGRLTRSEWSRWERRFAKSRRIFVAIPAGVGIIPLCLVPRSVGTPGRLHHDTHWKGCLVVKKLLALLIVLGVFTATVAVTGCGGTTGPGTKKAATDSGAGGADTKKPADGK